ncbi:MAG: hypothetical protein KDB90_15065 [Planctomycetes bacterium]|nr:hypothetical protein [Planctomycetota bacterium]
MAIRAILITLLAFGLAACASRQNRADELSDEYVQTLAKAGYDVHEYVPVHSAPKVGQYWQYRVVYRGVPGIGRFQVTKVWDDSVLVESLVEVPLEPDLRFAHVSAWRLDLNAMPGEPNILQAWVGVEGGKPIELQPVDHGTPDQPPPEVEGSIESFDGLALCGRTWSGVVVAARANMLTGELNSPDGSQARTWIADGGWFGGTLRIMQGEEVVGELSALGEDALPLMDWED